MLFYGGCAFDGHTGMVSMREGVCRIKPDQGFAPPASVVVARTFENGACLLVSFFVFVLFPASRE